MKILIFTDSVKFVPNKGGGGLEWTKRYTPLHFHMNSQYINPPTLQNKKPVRWSVFRYQDLIICYGVRHVGSICDVFLVKKSPLKRSSIKSMLITLWPKLRSFYILRGKVGTSVIFFLRWGRGAVCKISSIESTFLCYAAILCHFLQFGSSHSLIYCLVVYLKNGGWPNRTLVFKELGG